jgi:hypothetical protein
MKSFAIVLATALLATVSIPASAGAIFDQAGAGISTKHRDRAISDPNDGDLWLSRSKSVCVWCGPGGVDKHKRQKSEVYEQFNYKKGRHANKKSRRRDCGTCDEGLQQPSTTR